MSEGCDVLRTNVNDWSAEALWQTYIQLTQAESAFRIQKTELCIRPIWRQRKERVQAQLLDRLGLRLPSAYGCRHSPPECSANFRGQAV